MPSLLSFLFSIQLCSHHREINSKKVRHALVTNSVHEDSAGQLTMLEVRADYRWVKSRVYEHNLVKRN